MTKTWKEIDLANALEVVKPTVVDALTVRLAVGDLIVVIILLPHLLDDDQTAEIWDDHNLPHKNTDLEVESIDDLLHNHIGPKDPQDLGVMKDDNLHRHLRLEGDQDQRIVRLLRNGRVKTEMIEKRRMIRNQVM